MSFGKILSPFPDKGFDPLGSSQQYEDQQVTPDKVFHVEGVWRYNFFFLEEENQRDLQDEWTSAAVRVCPAYLPSAIRQTSLPIIFQTTSSLEATWKSCLHEIALDSEKYSRRLLGYFSSRHMEGIESLFATIGETDPCEREEAL